jgi:hypothetical protein
MRFQRDGLELARKVAGSRRRGEHEPWLVLESHGGAT